MSHISRAGADDGVDLINEEDDLAIRVGDLLDHGLQAVLKLAAVFGAGDQSAHVQRHQDPVLQGGGNVPGVDALRQPCRGWEASRQFCGYIMKSTMGACTILCLGQGGLGHETDIDPGTITSVMTMAATHVSMRCNSQSTLRRNSNSKI